jgi:peptidoglycan/LPS O-acetylase OafA/YrhL
VETRKGWIFTSIVNLIMTILISVISYTVLEKPFMKLKKRFALIASRDT